MVAWGSIAAASGALLETRAALPVVPPPHVRFPDAFDEQGCALIARDGSARQRVCPARRTRPSSASMAADWRRYLGYEGPPAAVAERGGVAILPETLTVASRGWWRAAGLVRNDTAVAAREIHVTVTLATTGDRPLGSATVLVPVRDVRPGEPAPFEVRTLVPVQAVRHVAWTVTAESGGTSSPSRMAEIEVGRIAPSPSLDASRPDAAVVSDADAAVFGAARIGWGILRNWGPLPISRATVVGMWIDEHGRAIRLVHGRVAPSSRGATSMGDLLPGGTRSFELFEQEASAAHGVGWRLALWQSTS